MAIAMDELEMTDEVLVVDEDALKFIACPDILLVWNQTWWETCRSVRRMASALRSHNTTGYPKD